MCNEFEERVRGTCSLFSHLRGPASSFFPDTRGTTGPGLIIKCGGRAEGATCQSGIQLPQILASTCTPFGAQLMKIARRGGESFMQKYGIHQFRNYRFLMSRLKGFRCPAVARRIVRIEVSHRPRGMSATRVLRATTILQLRRRRLRRRC